MTQTPRRPHRIAPVGASILSSLIVLSVLAGCAAPQSKSMVNPKRSKEYFSEREYGVAASPRVSTLRSRLPRGGGREQVGKPYMIKGKWYYPKEQPGYTAKGKASWYGDAFHGRLTANGEIYDMTHLTGAHPTMPLPSYARVTNLKNGSSVVVRINDRGPYAHGRVVDLSKRAAEMLDYTHSGIAEVKIDYVGRAPLDGHDEEYLLASYKPGNAMPDPSDGMATGVMIAMAGPTPTGSTGATATAATPFPGTMVSSGTAFTNVPDLDFPENGPVIMDRPLARAGGSDKALPGEILGYARSDESSAFAALAGLATNGLAPAAMAAVAPGAPYVAVGTFASRAEADRHAAKLSRYGHVAIEAAGSDFAVNLHADGRLGLDQLLELAWADGATDAFVVRD